MNEAQIKSNFFDAVKFVQSHNSLSAGAKRKIIEAPLGDWEKAWKPVAITPSALKYMAENKSTSGSGIQRCHNPLMDRKTYYEVILATDWDNADDLWNFYTQVDKTTLAMRGEWNSSDQMFTTNRAGVVSIPQDLNLFHNAGMGFKFGKAEKEWVMSENN